MRNPTSVVAALAVSLIAIVSACNQDGEAQLTYYGDAKKIVDAKCVTCHQPGAIGPFSLTTYEEVKSFEAAVASSVENGTMPPWMPSDDCSDYLGNIDLTEGERSTLLAWLSSGAAEGDPADAPEAAEAAGQAWSADLVLQLPEPYTPQIEPDDYRCQLIPWPYDEVVYVTGLRVIPDQRALVHHTIAFLVGPEQVAQFEAWDAEEEGPGYTCYGGPSASTGGGQLEGLDLAALTAALETLGLTLEELRSGTLSAEELEALFEGLNLGGGVAFSTLGSWVPGTPNLPLPEGTGIRVEPGSLVVAQMHYNTSSSAPVADQSTLELSIAESVDRQATNLPGLDLGWVSNGLLGPPMTLPAGEAEVTHQTVIAYDSLFVRRALTSLGLPFGEPLLIHAVNHHMHELGVRQTSTLRHADGTDSCLLDIPDWDFNWQGAYQLRQPIVLGPGDSVELSCTWDNSAANQPVVDGEVRVPADVTWGEGTSDEMCLAGYYVTAQ